jgi:hypothetical protein
LHSCARSNSVGVGNAERKPECACWHRHLNHPSPRLGPSRGPRSSLRMGSRPSLWMEPPSPLVKHHDLVVIIREEAASVWRLLLGDNSHLRCPVVCMFLDAGMTNLYRSRHCALPHLLHFALEREYFKRVRTAGGCGLPLRPTELVLSARSIEQTAQRSRAGHR